MNTGTDSPAQAAVGVLAGHAASVSESPLSLIADAAEELTFCLDNTEELELKERKQKKPAESVLLEKVQLYQELTRQVGQDRRANPLIQFLKSKNAFQNLLEKAKEFYPDPTDAWASLLEAREALAEEGAAAETLLAIDAAIEDLQTQSCPEIKAGLEAVLGRAGYEELGSVDELRSEYRQTVCDFPGVTEMFEFIMDKYGENDFNAAMDYLSKVLANDLASDSPSHDGRHLEAVASNLGQVRILNSAHGFCELLLDRWRDVHGAADSQLTPMALVKEILAIKRENYISSSRIDQIVKAARPPDIEKEVLFLQELLNTARGFSPRLFDSADNRLKFIDAVQQALDQAIAREDEYLASLE
jgi:type III secretion protein W